MKRLRRIIDIGQKAWKVLFAIQGSMPQESSSAEIPLTDLIPLCTAKDSDMPVTQYSMKPVEMVGMLKMDFLGLKHSQPFKCAVDAIKAKGQVEQSIGSICL